MAFALRVLLNLKAQLFLNLNYNLILQTDGIKNLDYHKTSGWNYDFFDTMIDPDTNTYLSEDYAFCRRWQKIGGSVYADITSGLTHHGTYGFAGDIKTQFLKRDE